MHVLVYQSTCLSSYILRTVHSDILGAFAKWQKAIISFVMSVRLSVRMEQLGSYWTDFH
jgi:hypothetical protein